MLHSFPPYIAALLALSPTNPVDDAGNHTPSNKEWAKRNYPEIDNFNVWTRRRPDGISEANLDRGAVWPEDQDDLVRYNEPAFPPNERRWYFETEADCQLWFTTEISNVVLAAFNRYPNILQTAEGKSLTEATLPETVDLSYTVKFNGIEYPVVIGEMKRATLHPVKEWYDGVLDRKSSKQLSQELRGYAHKYQCPQIFCFDGLNMLLLQFRADGPEEVASADCTVDAWIIPRENSTSTMRQALYYFLCQGLRRCQARASPGLQSISVGGLQPQSRQFYNGRLLWQGQEGQLVPDHPNGWVREIRQNDGALIWTRTDAQGVRHEVQETMSLW